MDQVQRTSSFLATKGLFPDHTYRAFAQWDLAESMDENVRRLRSANTAGGPSLGWLKDFGKILLRRFGPVGPAPALVELAQRRCSIAVWKPLLLWHCVRTDPLLMAFLRDWLYGEYQAGAVRVTREGAERFLRSYLTSHDIAWSDKNISSSAGGLLSTASNVGVIERGRGRRFQPFRLPDESLLYCAHELLHRTGSSSRLIGDATWRIFLLSTAAVESELLRLHQLHLLQFNRAGSLFELRLPYADATEYARRMTA